MDTGIKWYTEMVTNVDADTGEILRKDIVKNGYIKERIIKNVRFNYPKTKAYVQYTIIWRRNPQGELFKTSSE